LLKPKKEKRTLLTEKIFFLEETDPKISMTIRSFKIIIIIIINKLLQH